MGVYLEERRPKVKEAFAIRAVISESTEQVIDSVPPKLQNLVTAFKLSDPIVTAGSL